MKPGDSVELAGYNLPPRGVSAADGPNYRAARARIAVSGRQAGHHASTPRAHLYVLRNQPMTEAAIDPGLTRDLYVSLGDPLEGAYWLVKVQAQAVRRNDLDRLPDHGARRLARGERRRYRVAARERAAQRSSHAGSRSHGSILP